MTHDSATTTTPGTLSVQLYTFRDAYAADPAATIARVAGLGFRYAEPFGVGNFQASAEERMKAAKTLRSSLDASGLKATSAHVSAPLGDEAEGILDAIETVGVKLAIISWPGEVLGFERDVLSTPDGVERFAAAMNEAATNAARRGLKLGYHNHWWEWAGASGDFPSAYDALLARLDPSVLLELDVYWAQTGGQQPTEMLARLGERVQLMHLKDGPATPEAAQLPLGQGVVDNVAAVRAAPWVRWHVLEMDRTDGDVFAEVSRSAQTLIDAGVSRWE